MHTLFSKMNPRIL